MILTPEEEEIIQELRDNKIEFGELHCVYFFQHWAIIRMKIIEKVKSKVIKGE